MNPSTPRRRSLRGLLLAAALLAAAAAVAQSETELLQNLATSGEVSWRSPVAPLDPVYLRILGLNDLHGGLRPVSVDVGDGRTRPVGGAAVLAGYFAAERAQYPKHTLLFVAGDSIGASPAISGLLHDEPTLSVLNALAQGDCPPLKAGWAGQPAPVTSRCQVFATLGNHEFDQGLAELERLLYGGRAGAGSSAWNGMRIPFLVANVVHADGTPLLPAAAIVEVARVKIGVIGVVTARTPGLVMADRIQGLRFLPEAAAINAEVARLRARGVHTIVLVIHEGLVTPATPQRLEPVPVEELTGGLAAILGALDGGVDIVIAGHTHKLNNVLVPLKDHHLALVVQGRSGGTAYDSIDLTVDRSTGAMAAVAARIRVPYADAGVAPDKGVERIVAAAGHAVAAIEARPIVTASNALRQPAAPCAESMLGNLFADAERSAAATDFAFMNVGGLRAPLEAGVVTFGALYAVHPFGNQVVRFSLAGADVMRLLEEQWSESHAALPLCLAAAGLRYAYDLRRAPGHRVIAAADAQGQPLDPARRYSVAANDFLVGGGDEYAVLAAAAGVEAVTGVREAVEAYLSAGPKPLVGTLDGRMARIDTPPP
jgi:5'-nucleotidase